MEWNIKEIENIIQYINQELQKGRAMVSIEKEVFGVNERVINKRLIRLGYKKVNNQYIKLNNESNTTVIKANNKNITSVIKENNNSNTKVNYPIRQIKDNIEVLNDKSNITAIMELITLLEPIKALLERDSKIIDVEPIELKISQFRNVKAKVFKIDENILDRFEEFIKKNSHYKVQDIISQALLEFLDRYEK